MRLRCIHCEVLARPLYHFASISPHVVDLEFLPRGLHNISANLREKLQSAIDKKTTAKYDFILLGYGLCGLSIAGIVANDIPLIIPKAHDCITLFLGSRERYQQQFNQTPGTYWYVQDYMERQDAENQSISMGAAFSMDRDKLRIEYEKKYGKEKTEFLLQTMSTWQSHYERAAFIDTELADSSKTEEAAKSEAKRNKWKYKKFQADLSIIKKFLFGDWDDDFLKVQPGEKINQSYTDDVILCENCTFNIELSKEKP